MRFKVVALQLLLVEASADKQLAHQQEVGEVVWQLDKAGDTADNVEAVVVAYTHRVVDSMVGKIDHLEVEVPVDMDNAVLVAVSQNQSCFQALTLRLNLKPPPEMELQHPSFEDPLTDNMLFPAEALAEC